VRRYFIKLQEKVDGYLREYPDRPNKAAALLALWNLRCMLRPHEEPTGMFLSGASRKKGDSGKLKLAFRLWGGQGDALIALNYLYHLRKLAGCENIVMDVFFEKKRFYDFFVERGDYIDNVYFHDDLWGKHYDVVMDILFFPDLVSCDFEKLERLSPTLASVMKKYQEFKKDNEKIFRNNPYSGTQAHIYSLCCGRKRIQEADIDGLLGVPPRFQITISVKDEAETLNKFGLGGCEFITMHRGADVVRKEADSVKVWPLEYYNELIRLLRKTHSRYILVQLGASGLYSQPMEGVDVNLVGKTNMEEVKALLKGAALHIDGEGGLAHLRSALRGGKSVVLFGPTPMEFFGYEENINIRAEGACAHWCEWVIDDWFTQCVNRTRNCMKALTPNMVMEQIREEWSDAA
jgi:hypothetical protein